MRQGQSPISTDHGGTPKIHIIRHGQSLHNIQRGYPHRDPPLTDAGDEATKKIRITAIPDLIIISPMTRTIQTALNAFPNLLGSGISECKVEIWPDLREAHDAICNQGVSRAELAAKFPQFDFSQCPEEWDHAPHSRERALLRAETVRTRLRELSATYKNIVVITHRGFVAFLVQGDRLEVCETRSYRFATGDEVLDMDLRMGVHCETKEPQDFGPTVLVPWTKEA
ncbi:phosphoglycerate mutase-like protein [Lindgomyces ingoldianus]|uniref:Phosphoglycerate mutase-like protein n=1 Tax=Lindgomyces ingoldianus TaxID=673940 RepID=A0ACB6R8H5_9PLEO|nr:phosphoglycerate mutase-like protein [Lindgomyces ingoldianus]KAF2475045.1 phosphoglycerate mutase-like protein [Lindgomyces ingoldianus]